MFIATALLYPCALAVLCIGAGLLVDRLCDGALPAHVLPALGVAALIGGSQLVTLVPALAPATPYVLAAAALAGLVLGRVRAAALARALLARPLQAAMPVLVYALALAPVLVAGRPSFSSYMALADSAVHIMGADYLIHHGQSYAHLDLHNSYGQFVRGYYGTSYPSGADTLFGGSALLFGLPLIWAFQPFNAFVLATAYGPALLLARRLGLSGAWAVLAGVCSVVPALVYAYELLGSIKEVTALPMLLAAACLVLVHTPWRSRSVAAMVPLALVLAAGVSALGVAFGVWALVAVSVLAALLAVELRAGRLAAGRALALVAVGALAGALAALPTWKDLGGSLQVAGNIASTGNPGNLHSPLRTIQALGVWLGGSYKLAPAGAALTATHVLVGLALLAAILGLAALLRARDWAPLSWFALMLLAWLVVSRSVTTWASAKTLMLTSPALVLLAWTGVGAVRRLPPRRPALAAAALLALALAGGVLVSDVLQYRSTNLAPTARYEELASVGSRFAGRGPVLFTDFDEYALYELRRLDVGGPDFVYPPPALAAAAGGYGQPVRIDRIAPAALAAYPLIITRRDPSLARPPAAYELAWRGAYYEVWRRRAGAPPALEHRVLSGTPAAQCGQLAAAAAAAAQGGSLAAAPRPVLVRVDLTAVRAPRGWGRQRGGLAMKRAGSVALHFAVPSAGVWQLWIQGQLMPTVRFAIDGRPLPSVAGQLGGNSLVPNTVPPVAVELAAGRHTLVVRRSGATLAPGDGGSAVLAAVLLTRADGGAAVRRVELDHWRRLCGGAYQWVEALPST